MMDDDGVQADFDDDDVTDLVPYKLKYIEPKPLPAKRPPSPRVKPAAHYARVVANILCDRPCTRPISPPEVYADDLAKNIFKNPLHGDNGFQTYLDTKYGDDYSKKDIFHRELTPYVAKSVIASRQILSSRIPVENKNCLLPIYTKSYRGKINYEDCCGTDDESPRGKPRRGRRKDESSDEEVWVTTVNGKRVRRQRRKPQRSKQSQRSRYDDSDEDIYDEVIGRDGKVHLKRIPRSRSASKRKLARTKSSRKNIKERGYTSEEKWDHDKSGRRTKRKIGGYPQVGDPDYVSDEEWFHDKSGKRLRRKHPLTNGRRPAPGDPDYSSDEEWVHNPNGKRMRRKKPLQGGQRPQPGDLDYDSDEEWEHNKLGKRSKRKNNNPTSKSERGNDPQPGDTDYDSDEAWIHDQSGNRLKKRQQRPAKARKGNSLQPGDADYDSDEAWIHDQSGNRIKKRQERPKKGHSLQPGDVDYDSDEAWIHDQYGKRIKKKRQSKADYEDAENDEEVLDSKKRRSTKGDTHTVGHEGHEGTGRKSNFDPSQIPGRKSVGKGDFKGVRGRKKSDGTQLDDEDDSKLRRKPSWMTAIESKSGPGIKLKGVFRSQADLDEQMKKARLKSLQEPKPKVPTMQALELRSSVMDASKYVKKTPPKSPGEALKDLRSQRKEHPDEDEGLDEKEIEETPDPNNTKVVYTTTVETNQMESHNKIGCAGSLWGILPIPAGDLLQNGQLPCSTEKVNIEPKNVLKEETAGAFGDYASIPANVSRYKQIFRDEARALGLPRPSTAEVTSRMIERTAKNVKKQLEEGDREDLLDPQKKVREAYKKEQKRKKRFIDPKKRSVPLTTVLFDLMKREDNEFGEGEEGSKSGLLDDPKDQRQLGPFRDLHPGVMDETARRFHGVTSGPFIPHIDRSQRNRITFSLVDNPPQFKPAKHSMKGGGDGRASYPKQKGSKDLKNLIGEDDDDAYFQENEEGFKLPNLAVREKTSNAIIHTNSNGSPPRLPSIDNIGEDEEYIYTDKLLYPSNSNPEANVENKGNKKKSVRNSLRKSGSLPPLEGKQDMNSRKPRKSSLGKDRVLAQYQVLGGQGDQQDIPMSPCWEMASKLFKSPLRAPAIPLPDNLVIHIEKKCPGLQWPRGQPVAVRYYPTGQPFCVVFQNGAGRVHYPHGGLAVAISAPTPRYSRVLVIRDSFDQFYFFDKAILADLNCNGMGTVYDEHGIIKAQYNLQGGYRQEGVDKPSQRWQWNQGGQRLILKLNRYMALRILDIDKIHLVFYGNKRGFRLNVGAGQRVNLMSVTCDGRKAERPKSACGGFDYIRGRFSTPVLGFLDKSRQDRCMTAVPGSLSEQPLTYKYSFSQCHITDAGKPCKSHDCYVENCRDGY